MWVNVSWQCRNFQRALWATNDLKIVHTTRKDWINPCPFVGKHSDVVYPIKIGGWLVECWSKWWNATVRFFSGIVENGLDVMKGTNQINYNYWIPKTCVKWKRFLTIIFNRFKFFFDKPPFSFLLIFCCVKYHTINRAHRCWTLSHVDSMSQFNVEKLTRMSRTNHSVLSKSRNDF